MTGEKTKIDETTAEELRKGYDERPEEELSALRKAAQYGVIGGYNYVAEPVEGYDIRGIWTCYHASSRTGYAHIGHGLTWALADMGLPVMLIPHRIRDIVLDMVPDDRYEDVIRFRKGMVGIGEILILLYPPLESSFMKDMATVVLPWVTHEGSAVARNIGAVCNDTTTFRNGLWTHSEFARMAYEAGGVRPEQLTVVEPPLIGGPWQVPTAFSRHESNRRMPVNPTVPFVFGYVGTWHERKGFHDLVRAYYHAFSGIEPVRLEIRTSSVEPMETIPQLERRVVADIVRIKEEWAGRTMFPPVRAHIGTKASDVELIDWLGALDCYANGSYGEGTGIPQVYAAAQGVTLVTGEFGAVGELASAMNTARREHREEVETAYDGAAYDHQIVKSRIERVPMEMLRLNRLYDLDTEWGRYYPAVFGAAMRQVYDRGRGRDLIGQQVPRRRHSFDRFKERMVELLPQLCPAQAAKWFERPRCLSVRGG